MQHRPAQRVEHHVGLRDAGESARGTDVRGSGGGGGTLGMQGVMTYAVLHIACMHVSIRTLNNSAVTAAAEDDDVGVAGTLRVPNWNSIMRCVRYVDCIRRDGVSSMSNACSFVSSNWAPSSLSVARWFLTLVKQRSCGAVVQALLSHQHILCDRPQLHLLVPRPCGEHVTKPRRPPCVVDGLDVSLYVRCGLPSPLPPLANNTSSYRRDVQRNMPVHRCCDTTVRVAPGSAPKGRQSRALTHIHPPAAPTDCTLLADATRVP